MLKKIKKSSIESVFQKVQELFVKSRTSEEMDRNTQIDNVQVERTQNLLLRPNNTFFSLLWSAPAIYIFLKISLSQSVMKSIPQKSFSIFLS
jgi:hypothetical protein